MAAIVLLFIPLKNTWNISEFAKCYPYAICVDMLNSYYDFLTGQERAFKFVAKITTLFMKLQQTNDPSIKDKLKPPTLKQSIRSLLQLE